MSVPGEAQPTYASIVDRLTAQLSSASDTPRLDAELLVRSMRDWDRTAFFLHLREPFPLENLPKLKSLADRRMAGEPIAYLLGKREFIGLEFTVSPAVLIPRPETELLVEWALARLRERPDATVVDVGTGSGAIAVSLASQAGPDTHLRVVGSDYSDLALQIARANARNLTPGRRVHFVRGNLIDWLRGPVDLVLANLPYLTPEQLVSNPALCAEPRLALIGGADGLDLVRRLVADLPRVLAVDGAFGLELDPAQIDSVRDLVSQQLPGFEFSVIDDLQGMPRHLVGVGTKE